MIIGKLNDWLTLIANFAVLLGILVVVFELQQTQILMQAEAGTMRSELAIETQELDIEIRYRAITEKIISGTPLTEEEESNLERRWRHYLRYWENMHYQWELGILDEEIWEANLVGIRRFSQNPSFTHLYPDWPNSFIASIHRKSFVELTVSFSD